MEHIPGPRKIETFLPILILISGKSGSGKSTISQYLNKCENIKYFSLDTFTIDPNVPIPSLNNEVKIMGDDAYLKIPILEKHIKENIDIFIQYCYDNTIKLKYDVYIFDGVYFNDLFFLNAFKNKFNKEYKIWVMSPQ
jgi:RNase adaptor protein for sRNA GlmZ degradation